jgi:hypothetical protein
MAIALMNAATPSQLTSAGLTMAAIHRVANPPAFAHGGSHGRCFGAPGRAAFSRYGAVTPSAYRCGDVGQGAAGRRADSDALTDGHAANGAKPALTRSARAFSCALNAGTSLLQLAPACGVLKQLRRPTLRAPPAPRAARSAARRSRSGTPPSRRP